MQRSRRTFSKRVIIINGILAWITVFASIHYEVAEIGVTALGVLATIITAYMGVGHMDFRSMLNMVKGTDDSGSPSQSS